MIWNNNLSSKQLSFIILFDEKKCITLKLKYIKQLHIYYICLLDIVYNVASFFSFNYYLLKLCLNRLVNKNNSIYYKVHNYHLCLQASKLIHNVKNTNV